MNDQLLVSRVDAVLAQRPAYPCALLVHREIATLAEAAGLLQDRFTLARFSVGLTLSQELLNVAPKQRSIQATRVVRSMTAALTPGLVLWVDIDLLFEPSLALDPLALMRECSRQTPVVVMWPGEYKDKVLSYAVPEHAHYRIWRQTDLCDQCIIPL